MKFYEVIKSPLVSEKALNLRDSSPNAGQLVAFRVDRRSKKADIKNAVEKLFNVKVRSVNTANCKGKTVRRGRYVGKKSDWKKAYVTLAPGYNIEDYLNSL
ncbi:50S ribosomal protein L23 [Chloracidobacterium aggregatum]|jgi:large subunit ribosomal protein L23|uniref:Large ribosomal subunit protein uL23 n=1 Tax=Chloracidobacterium sp. N TaxID=2821540 RepID=A0ABX8AWX7_9BACT|nr:50S ribosomal protein L23 [Chloracidobacterium aggregatum]QUV84437.1 50S ribosomal protein L23 [Chloracidobacterium sp. 2]QUV87069.1 50S ribosomal protein L23 [Chloracidobacterium sp. S]QUV89979.1 50S ribosomal protein L23 [Chloracidobacterium sp. A]QUV93190.1 50S ribosomal protein L23 [Chloracidobacterium sp. N]QUV96345.1 50S ribosomal protein L23 [Chloracidobacterium sp. E]